MTGANHQPHKNKTARRTLETLKRRREAAAYVTRPPGPPPACVHIKASPFHQYNSSSHYGTISGLGTGAHPPNYHTTSGWNTDPLLLTLFCGVLRVKLPLVTARRLLLHGYAVVAGAECPTLRPLRKISRRGSGTRYHWEPSGNRGITTLVGKRISDIATYAYVFL